MFSNFHEREVLPNTLSIKLRIQRRSILHQSSAGIGRRLNTPRFTEISAESIMSNVIPELRAPVITETIPIGPATESSACSLSLGVSGAKIFFHSKPSHERVSLDCTYTS